MSATDRTAADFESAAVAHVHFRVRCETLGHGEEVFLVPDGGGAAKVRDDAVTTRHTSTAYNSWKARLRDSTVVPS